MILSTAKNTSELRLCSRFHISISFQNYWTYYFFCIPEIKFSTIKEIFHNQVNFPQSRKFPSVKEISHNQIIFTQLQTFSRKKNMFYCCRNLLASKKFSTIKSFFHNCGNLPQSKNVSTVVWAFSLVKNIFCKQRLKRLSKS